MSAMVHPSEAETEMELEPIRGNSSSIVLKPCKTAARFRAAQLQIPLVRKRRRRSSQAGKRAKRYI